MALELDKKTQEHLGLTDAQVENSRGLTTFAISQEKYNQIMSAKPTTNSFVNSIIAYVQLCRYTNKPLKMIELSHTHWGIFCYWVYQQASNESKEKKAECEEVLDLNGEFVWDDVVFRKGSIFQTKPFSVEFYDQLKATDIN